MQDSVAVSPASTCESSSYVLMDAAIFPTQTKLIVPMGYQAAVWKDPYSYSLCYPGEYMLRDYLPAQKAGFAKSELHGKIGYINKQIKYKLCWGTGSRIFFDDPTLERKCDVGFSGSLTLKVDMSEVFLRYIRQNGIGNLKLESIAKEKMPAFSNALGQALQQAIRLRELDYRGISGSLPDLSALVTSTSKLREIYLPYGIWMDDFIIENCIFSQDVESLL